MLPSPYLVDSSRTSDSDELPHKIYKFVGWYLSLARQSIHVREDFPISFSPRHLCAQELTLLPSPTLKEMFLLECSHTFIILHMPCPDGVVMFLVLHHLPLCHIFFATTPLHNTFSSTPNLHNHFLNKLFVEAQRSFIKSSPFLRRCDNSPIH